MGPVGKAAVVGLKDRETNTVKARRTDAPTLQGFVTEHRADGAKVYMAEDAHAQATDEVTPLHITRWQHGRTICRTALVRPNGAPYAGDGGQASFV